MAIQNLGTTYQIGLDYNTLDVTAYALIVIGRNDLAKEFLLVANKDEEFVDNAIAVTRAKLIAQTQETQNAPEDTASPEPVPEQEPVPAPEPLDAPKGGSKATTKATTKATNKNIRATGTSSTPTNKK